MKRSVCSINVKGVLFRALSTLQYTAHLWCSCNGSLALGLEKVVVQPGMPYQEILSFIGRVRVSGNSSIQALALPEFVSVRFSSRLC